MKTKLLIMVFAFIGWSAKAQCVATFSYTGTPYCGSGINPSPTYSGGGVAGTFTSTSGLSINSSTGNVNLSLSTPGTYSVTNSVSTSGGCFATSSITINAAPTIANAGANQNVCGSTTSTERTALQPKDSPTQILIEILDGAARIPQTGDTPWDIVGILHTQHGMYKASTGY